MAVGQGIHFKVVNEGLYDTGLFAGICVAHGCAVPAARKIADKVTTEREAKTTVTPSVNLVHLKAACNQIGLLVIPIAPRR